jgi:hypothetical protein
MRQRDPSTDTATRSAIENEASKVLALINGGGAAAFAALLQAVWDKWEPVSRAMVIDGIGFMLLGLAVVPLTLVLRYINGLLAMSYRPFRNPLWYVILLPYLAPWSSFWSGCGTRLRVPGWPTSRDDLLEPDGLLR